MPLPATAAVDTHAHVFHQGLALADTRRHTPDYDATLAQYLELLDGHGLSHGVLVQPSFLGTDNSHLLQALRAAPARLRGVAVVDPAIDDPGLQALAAAGVVGIRLNLIGLDLPDLAAPPGATCSSASTRSAGTSRSTCRPRAWPISCRPCCRQNAAWWSTISAAPIRRKASPTPASSTCCGKPAAAASGSSCRPPTATGPAPPVPRRAARPRGNCWTPTRRPT